MKSLSRLCRLSTIARVIVPMLLAETLEAVVTSKGDEIEHVRRFQFVPGDGSARAEMLNDFADVAGEERGRFSPG